MLSICKVTNDSKETKMGDKINHIQTEVSFFNFLHVVVTYNINDTHTH